MREHAALSASCVTGSADSWAHLQPMRNLSFHWGSQQFSELVAEIPHIPIGNPEAHKRLSGVNLGAGLECTCSTQRYP